MHEQLRRRANPFKAQGSHHEGECATGAIQAVEATLVIGAIVSAENWHEERERLVLLLEAIKSGKITHIDEEDLRQLQATNAENIAAIEQRLAKLNARLGGS